MRMMARRWFDNIVGAMMLAGLSFLNMVIWAVNPLAATVLLVLAVLFTLAMFFTEAGIYAVLFVNPFDRLTAVAAGSPITLTKVLLLCVGGAVFVKKILYRDNQFLPRLFDNGVTISSYAFLLFSFASVLNANDYELFSGQMIRRTSVLLLYLLLILSLQRPDQLYRIFKFLLMAYVFIGMTGLYELISTESILQLRFGNMADFALYALSESDGIRISGPYGDPNFHAVAMFIPLALTIAFFYLKRHWAIRLLMLFLFAFFMINLLATNSRGGLVGSFFIFGAMYLFLRFRYKLLFPFVAGILAAVIVGAYMTLFPAATVERYSGESGWQSIKQRIGLIEMSVDAIRDEPLLGIGTGNFISKYQHYMNEKVPRHPLWPHNSILQAWAENGIFGLLAFLAVLGFATRNVLVVAFQERDPLRHTMAVTVGSVIAGYWFFAAVNNVLENQDYWIIFSFSVALYRWHLEERSTGRRMDGSPLFVGDHQAARS